MGMVPSLRECYPPRDTVEGNRCPKNGELNWIWEDLVDRIRTRDGDAAYVEFRDRFFPAIRLIVRRMFGAECCSKRILDCAEDALSEAYIAVLDGVLKDSRRLPGFVSSIARSVGYHNARKSCTWRFVPLDSEDSSLAVETEGGDDWLDREMEQKLIVAALESLTPLQRNIVERFYVLGQSPDSIQLALGITKKQFQTNKSRGKSRLVEKCRKLLIRRELRVISGAPSRAAMSARA